MAFERLLIHKSTKEQLDNFLKMPSHGLVLVAPTGSGKKTLARHLAFSLLGLESVEKLENYPYFTLINPEGTSIAIEDIRNLQKNLTLRTPKTGRNIRRILLVINAGRMRSEAQNAFLKSLEEPPLDTCIIFTAESDNDLLPTIFSRMQRIDVRPVDSRHATEYFKSVKPVDLQRNYALSQGQVGLLYSLLNNQDHPLKVWVENAKEILSKPSAGRLFSVDSLSKEKTDAIQFVAAMRRIAHAALLSAGKTNNQAAVNRWQNGLNLAANAHDALIKNANTKLVLDQLLLNL